MERLNSSQPGCVTESTELVPITKGKTELIPTWLCNRKHRVGYNSVINIIRGKAELFLTLFAKWQNCKPKPPNPTDNAEPCSALHRKRKDCTVPNLLCQATERQGGISYPNRKHKIGSHHKRKDWTHPNLVYKLVQQTEALRPNRELCIVYIEKEKAHNSLISQKERLNSSQVVHIRKGKNELIPTWTCNRKHRIGSHYKRKDRTHPNLVV